MNICPVILAGGTGTRLWPISRELMPKQFLQIIGDSTLFQQTALRSAALCDRAPLIVCHDNHYFHCQDQLETINIDKAQYLLEPMARNTAGAVALAALHQLAQGQGETPMLIMPSDHFLNDIDHMTACVNAALPFALSGQLVTFGIRPTKPETGYGYIEQGPSLGERVCSVKQFVEKPDRETADGYMQSGKFLWNSGIFMMTPQVYLNELKQHEPHIYQCALDGFQQGQQKQDYRRIHPASYAACPHISIDYAVMEKSEHIVVVALDTAWSDLGCWASVSEQHERDEHHNVLIGKVTADKSHDCYIHAEDDRLIAAIGLQHTMVISTADAILVADKRYAQDVKTLVEHLKANDHACATMHQRVYRPWGYYESLESGPKYQVKRIMVKPHARLSLQVHQHRAEHWVVVQGVAVIENGGQQITLQANQSTYIPKGAEHRLCNHTDEPLHVIEVQSGDYLGEDDIVRLHDDYSRVM